jgi:serine/threonine-protein kinase
VKPPVQAGDVLASKYRIDRVLGSGAMGVVVSARQLDLGFPVAIKFMSAAAAASKAASQRFIREARAAARLRSEHVARVIDFGKLDDGAPYIVMEYLEGADLDALRRQHVRLPPHDVAAYVLQACKGLSEAHANGIVHRDLKPHNLFLTRRPDGTPLVKILDFGVSKLTETLDESGASEPGADLAMTRTSSMMGTPMYMSPEQLRSSRRVDERSDIFSLGVTMYQLVSGKLPFSASSFGDLVIVVTTTLPQPLASLAPDVPPALIAVVERCLAKDPALRYRSVDELAHALAPICDPQRSASGVEAIGTLADAAVSQSQPQQPSRGLVVGLGATGVVAVIGIAALIGFGRSHAQSESAAEEIAPPSATEPSTPQPSAQPSAPEPNVAASAPSASANVPPLASAPPPPNPSARKQGKPPPPPQPSAPPPPPPPRDPFGSPDG